MGIRMVGKFHRGPLIPKLHHRSAGIHRVHHLNLIQFPDLIGEFSIIPLQIDLFCMGGQRNHHTLRPWSIFHQNFSPIRERRHFRQLYAYTSSRQQKAATEPEKALTELKAMNASLEEMSPHLSPELQAKAKEVDVAVRSIVLDGKPLRETVDGLMQQWKRERPEVEINFYDNTLRTNNEIVREAVKDDIAQDAAKEAAKKGTAEAAKELGKEAAVQGAETAARGVAAAGTGGLALAVEVGYKILSSVAEELKHQITR